MSVADLVTKADLPAVVRDLRAKLKLVARAAARLAVTILKNYGW